MLGKTMKKILTILAVVILAGVLGILVIRTFVDRVKARSYRPFRDLGEIRFACEYYATEHGGQFPASWEALLSYSNQVMRQVYRSTSAAESIFLRPSAWAHYRYISGLSTASPPFSVLAYRLSSAPNPEYVFVLYVGGSPQSRDARDFQRNLDETLGRLGRANQAVEPTRAPEGTRSSP